MQLSYTTLKGIVSDNFETCADAFNTDPTANNWRSLKQAMYMRQMISNAMELGQRVAMVDAVNEAPLKNMAQAMAQALGKQYVEALKRIDE